MLLNEILPFLVRYWPAVLISSTVAYLLTNKFWKGLNKYPGHWVAGYTNWWRLYDVLGWKHQWTQIALHREHGDVVRLGPNVLSFADPRAIKIIYGLNKGVMKSGFYPVQTAVAKGKTLYSLFSTVDEDFHAKYRRCVNSAFAMTSLVNYEPLVNSTLTFWLDRTQEMFANTGNSCNFSQWLQFFAFDVIGELTWSKRLGFVEENRDVDNIVAFLGKLFDYVAPAGQMPILDRILWKNPITLFAQRIGLDKRIHPVVLFALSRSNERASQIEKIKRFGLSDDERANPRGIDLLSKFAQASHDHSFMDDERILSTCTSMVFAGSETTAISLSAVFYFLVKHPLVYAKLMQELDAAVAEGRIESRPDKTVSWAEAQKLPYLDAVVQESFRLHPAPGLILERVVPLQGMQILGDFIPGGTIVGCNAWVVHRRPEVFGVDVDTFRPERWIEASPEKLKEMKGTMLQFGAGARTCIGKNISLLEIYKLVPSFLRRFEIELERPGAEWKTHNAWFVTQKEFNTRFRPRQVPV
ncbi:pisatin demethylase [Dothidotthia symphoricarpi CBS 119687]|uniref:Pisatin demethylase n=1 Tax=Dothidotthia symphoricarpi CBS 119687 TaxID=1392245 RepID=A0A6A6A1Q9_9PLEO|nr:pisatin demethylase [Dothidotthia symphoricarpi CBS 119687]KAF2125779.1 pisatin demethylase [Dothidotthia symphoricarpi CBS 119687]